MLDPFFGVSLLNMQKILPTTKMVWLAQNEAGIGPSLSPWFHLPGSLVPHMAHVAIIGVHFLVSLVGKSFSTYRPGAHRRKHVALC